MGLSQMAHLQNKPVPETDKDGGKEPVPETDKDGGKEPVPKTDKKIKLK